MSTEVTTYITQAPETQKQMMTEIRALIHAIVPGVKESIKWGRPVFSTHTDFAYFKTGKTYLSFGFFKIEKIFGDADLLEGTGKEMRHIKLKQPADLKPAILKRWIKQVTN